MRDMFLKEPLLYRKKVIVAIEDNDLRYFLCHSDQGARLVFKDLLEDSYPLQLT